MTQEHLKQLEKELWDAADQLRANSKLTAAEYKDPVLGLILLRFAQNRYEEAKIAVEKAIPEGPRGKRKPTKDDFKAAGAIMLPEKASYDHLANLPESHDIAEAINNAMRLIEAEYPDLAGILPKNYQDFEADLLRELVRVFNKDAVKKTTGDVFGRIYEYFLMKFSMLGAGAQEGGEFFTPPSLVQLIVNFIEPDHGIIHDPACGSGGMFVQTGYFVRSHTNKEVNEAITVYGTEQKTNNTKLAKMNLAIHGIEGKIIEANSFYSDPHNLVGKCDFVMANPPFNVKKIDKGKEFVKTDKRLFPGIGVPKADNGNYMWMQYFYHYLNDKGRAGFVMASSATDAGNSELLIRQELIETGHVDAIVAIGNNFFYTRSLPCHLWFFDKGKRKENKDKILMIDARNVKRKVTSTINDFSPEQLEGLTAIVKMYRGEKPEISKTNQWFKQHFPKGKYQDIEGLCKIVDLEEVIRQEYTLTPGRYVGYTFDYDEGFNFKNEISKSKDKIEVTNEKVNKKWKEILTSINDNYAIDEYREVPFADVVEFQIGGGWGSDTKNDEFSEPAYVIRGTDFDNVELGTVEGVPYRFHKKSNLRSRKLQAGDIIFEVSGGSSNAGVAKSIIITASLLEQFNDDVMCASFCKLIRLKRKDLAPYIFLYLRFLRDTKAAEVFEVRSASNIINYNFSAFLKFQNIIVPNPESDFIRKFNDLVVPMMDSILSMGIQTNEMKNALRIVFPGLMQQVK